MRTISFHKLEDTVLCVKCRKNPVPANRPLRPCQECRYNDSEAPQNIDLGTPAVGTKLPAARVVSNDGKKEVYVDKFGKVVDNPGYDLDNDPRGYYHTGRLKRKGTVTI